MHLRKPAHILPRLLIALLCAACLLLAVLLCADCPFRSLTGIPCPGCGMSRAWLAALRLDFFRAFQYNPMFWAVPLVALYGIWGGAPFTEEKWNRALGWFLLGGVGVCWCIQVVRFALGCSPL